MGVVKQRSSLYLNSMLFFINIDTPPPLLFKSNSASMGRNRWSGVYPSKLHKCLFFLSAMSQKRP